MWGLSEQGWCSHDALTFRTYFCSLVRCDQSSNNLFARSSIMMDYQTHRTYFDRTLSGLDTHISIFKLTINGTGHICAQQDKEAVWQLQPISKSAPPLKFGKPRPLQRHARTLPNTDTGGDTASDTLGDGDVCCTRPRAPVRKPRLARSVLLDHRSVRPAR